MRLTRRGRLTATVAALLLVGTFSAYLLLRTPVGTALGLTAGPPCTLTLGEDTLEWSREQAMTATTVAGVGTRIGASVNGVAKAVARSLEPQPAAALPVEVAREIYRGLPETATPDRRAVRVAQALLGHDGGALSCVLPITESVNGEEAGEVPGALGLTPRADGMRLAMRSVFGKQALGGFDPEGVDSGHVEGSAHYEGRAIDVFFRPVTPENQRLGWQQANWSVAHADRLDLATVIFDARIWSARRSIEGWRDYSYPGGTDNPVLLHEDHVHVDVVATGPSAAS